MNAEEEQRDKKINLYNPYWIMLLLRGVPNPPGGLYN